MRGELRLGVVGAGRVFQRYYVPALERVNGLRLVAIVEPDAVRRAATPGEGVRRLERLDEMLDGGEIDAVAVLSPARFHGAQVAEVLRRRVPVLVEKPAAMSLAELEPWSEAGPLSLVTVGFSKRFWPFYQRAKRRGPADRFDLGVSVANWASFDEEGAVPEQDLLPHLVDLCRWWRGDEIASVEATRRGGRVETRLRLESGRSVECVAEHGDRYRERVTAGGRSVARDAPGLGDWLSERIRQRIQRLPADSVLGVARMLNEWAARIQGEATPSLADAIDAWASVAVVDACVESAAAGGTPVEVRRAPESWRSSVARETAPKDGGR